MLKNGVYTTKCPKCSRSVLIHLSSDGSISPNKCSQCEIGFESIEKGEQRNTFVVVAKKKESKIVAKEEAEEKVAEKPKERKVIVKSHKESFKVWKDN